jgi:hypothetical protein
MLMAAGQAHATLYTQDPNLSDFASPTSTFATFSNFTGHDAGVTTPTYTPTFTTLNEGLRIFAGTFTATGLPTTPAGQNWILATFATPQSEIRLFPNIDHPGAFDGYQYQIYGSNSLTTGWTPLFDALTVTGSAPHFTLGSFTGTAPTVVNNTLTPGAGPNGTVGYEADFNFGTAYKHYALGASTEAIHSGNVDQEFSAAIVALAVPEPATWLLPAIALAGLFGWRTWGAAWAAARRRRA